MQAGDLVLRIGLPNVLGESDMVKGDAGLRMQGLRRGNRGLSHVTEVIHHHAIIHVGGAVIERHEIDDVVAAQSQALDLLHYQCADTPARDRIG